jgi:hypothetical protein
MYAPQYQDKLTYSNYLYYRTNITVNSNTPYSLNNGDYIYFYETRDDANRAVTDESIQPKYKITQGNIRANFNLTSTVSTYDSLNNNKSISVIDYVGGPLG